MTRIYDILDRKRTGRGWSTEDLQEAVRGAVTGDWDDAQLAAFLMAAATRGLDPEETRELTRAMLESGERWELGREIAQLGDKHSTGGVGDKVSLVLGPLLAACGIPIVMLTGRSLGHTGGTADKLECIPGLDLELDRDQSLRLLEEVGLAIGVPTGIVAPADGRLYALRDRTGTVAAIPLVVSSILSKKLATGAGAIVFDVKVGDGAFFPEVERGRELAAALVETCGGLGVTASAWLTDMSQPLGRWAGCTMEMDEAIRCLAGEGPPDLVEIVLTLGAELATLLGSSIGRERLEQALDGGLGLQKLEEWARRQGAPEGWLDAWEARPASVEAVIESPRSGRLAAVPTRRLGLALNEDHRTPGGADVALESLVRLGEAVQQGQPLARIHLTRERPDLLAALREGYRVTDRADAPPLLVERVGSGEQAAG